LDIPEYCRLAVADMHPAAGLELVIGEGGMLRLYSWDRSGGRFEQIDWKRYSYNETPLAESMACADLDGDGYSESVYLCGWKDPLQPTSSHPPFYSLVVYDWNDQQTHSQRTWEDAEPPVAAVCAGELAGTAEVGIPLGSYDPLAPGSYPALLVDPLSPADPIDCEPGNVASAGVKYGMFADWDQLVEGLDAFVIPAENQCLAWDNAGNALSGWPVDYSGGNYDKAGISPPALGDLNGDGWTDVLSSTRENANGLVKCLDKTGRSLEDLQFPFVLPEEVDVSSGFAVADIDRDGKVEIVFGTSEGLLHVWELGACDPGYAPWPQHRHDAGRTGVLE
ncbi:MAG: VCBS repeat-containing protein, partial [Candidatus Fermentibacteraceae bacterium]